jgi:nitrogen fixation/metabolism regulation signal transduction histidine kinase
MQLGGFSLAGRLAALLVAATLVSIGLTRLGVHYGVPEWRAALLSLALAIPLVLWAASRFLRPIAQTIAALSDGIRSFHDRDFSVRIANPRRDELGGLIALYNQVGEVLQRERAHLRQRELLLQSALDQSPVAIVLVSAFERVLYANTEARQQFLGGERLAGRHFREILDGCPPEMRQVLDSGLDGIFTVETDDGPETYHVAQRRFLLNQQPHRLYQLRRMTAELARQEVEIWKRVIRIISHELNNSLAPISSLAHSARTIAERSDPSGRLEPIFASIRERVEHLNRFLEGYARFARLPEPEKREVDWQEWLEVPRKLYPFELAAPPPRRPGWFDPSQMQQVLINLLKNASEASDDGTIRVKIERLPDGRTGIQVSDRGRGMSSEVLRQALLPFYTTKPAGTGVGLPLCREIIEAHGGVLRIQSREREGTTVTFWLPAGPEAQRTFSEPPA